MVRLQQMVLLRRAASFRFSVLRLFTTLVIMVVLAGCGASNEPSPMDPTVINDQASPPSPETANADTDKVILFLGNSLSAGYGLDPESAFPALTRQKIDSLGWPFRVINAGLSGETTAGGLRRVEWLLRQPIDVLVLELGGNDGLWGISTEETRRNLQKIIDLTREKYPDVTIVLAGMQIPTNLGGTYTAAFRTLFPELARANQAALIPFLLEGVGGISELNLPDGIHPTAEGHKIVAENVWQVLGPVLETLRQKPV